MSTARRGTRPDWTAADYDSYQILAAMGADHPAPDVRVNRARQAPVPETYRACAGRHRQDADRHESAGDTQLRDMALTLARSDDRAADRCQTRTTSHHAGVTWLCPACGTWNDTRLRFCIVCDAPRAADRCQTATTALTYPRRAVEPGGTVHAARYAGDRQHFTTACAIYPAPVAVSLEYTGDRPITCAGCRAALATDTRPTTGNVR
jgi:hypothetical protein